MHCLRVSNLPGHWGEIHLRRLFGRYGPIHRVLMVFDPFGQDAACAYVEMAHPDHAAVASDRLHGRRFRYRRIEVRPHHVA